MHRLSALRPRAAPSAVQIPERAGHANAPVARREATPFGIHPSHMAGRARLSAETLRLPADRHFEARHGGHSRVCSLSVGLGFSRWNIREQCRRAADNVDFPKR